MLIPWLESLLPGKKTPQCTALRTCSPSVPHQVRLGKRWISTTSGTGKGRKGILSSSFDIPCRHTHTKRCPFYPTAALNASSSHGHLWQTRQQHSHGALKCSRLKKNTHKKQPQTQELWPARGLQRFSTCQINFNWQTWKPRGIPSAVCISHAWKANVSKEDTMYLQIPVWLEQWTPEY